MAKRKLMTIEDLVRFCKEQNFTRFSSKESGYKLAVQVPTTFEIDENVDEDHRGMLKLKFRIFHTGLNRNGSFVSEESAKAAMPTIKNRPIMAAIHQLDNGEWDFESHNYETIKNEETGEEEIVYIEKQVGSFDESEPFFEYDKDLDKTYVCGYGYISEEYTKAADIIRRKNGTKNSCELSIEELSFNVKESYLSLDKFYVAASTLLGSKKDGTKIGEGMLGSRADIADFSEENNSMFSKNDKLIEMLEQLNTKIDNLSNFTIKDNVQSKLEEGGKTLVKFEELLKKYNKTIEEITFEYENLSDEELEEKFEEVFGENTEGEGADPEPTSEGDEGNNDPEDDDSKDDENNENENDDTKNNNDGSEEDEKEEGKDNPDDSPEEYSLKCSVTCGDAVKEFSISLSEKINAISTLVNETYESDGTWYYVDVFDEEKYVIMQDLWNGKAYKQSYKVKKDSYSLSGDRVEVFSIFVTADERKKLDDMRVNYASISEKLAKYEAEPAKMEILNSESYAKIAETKEFVELRDNHFDLSVEEVSAKADAILLDYAKAGNINFSAEEKKKSGMTKLPIQTKSNKKSRYGSLFSK